MSESKPFLKTRKGRGLILGSIGAALIFALFISPSVNQPQNGLNNDYVFGYEVIILIPVILTLLIVGHDEDPEKK